MPQPKSSIALAFVQKISRPEAQINQFILKRIEFAERRDGEENTAKQAEFVTGGASVGNQATNELGNKDIRNHDRIKPASDRSEGSDRLSRWRPSEGEV